MPRNYEESRLVYVTIEGYPTLLYTFKTRVRSATSTDLGHTGVQIGNISSAQGYVVGAQSPKPPRASRRTETGIEGSFVDKDSVTTAKQNGYQLSKGRVRRGANTAFTRVKYININGIKYAWNSPTSSQEPGDVASAGVRDATPDDVLVFGADFPKPPRLKKEVANGSYYSTFADPNDLDTAIENGWIPANEGLYTTPQLKQFL